MTTQFWKYIKFVATCLFTQVHVVNAQVSVKDSVTLQDTVYKVSVQEFAAVPAIKVQDSHPPNYQQTLVGLINTIPGMRMEERSPGSYRLNIRGSSLRSPFGVRNVKVYWNNLPLTDPGGNTYFNQIAVNNFTSMTFIKSTASVLYGAGTGGQVIIENIPAKKSGAIEIVGGSYGSKTFLASANFANKKVQNKITYAHNQTDGYREQSKMRRDNLSWAGRIQLTDRQQLTAGLLYTDMYYQTPGGLTLQEYKANPKMARPATGISPSAPGAKAAIFQKNLTAGLNYTNQFTSAFSNTTTIYGAYNRINNSAIRNYEMRNEPHWGGRTVFKYSKRVEDMFRIDWSTGGEIQSGKFNVKVFGNKSGAPDTIQTNDNVQTSVYNIFSQLDVAAIDNNWNGVLAIAYNRNNVVFERLSDNPVMNQPFYFGNVWLPRIGIVKKIGSNFSIVGNISKGFAAPTIAELLPSTGIINTTLQAEKGWNYELIFKGQLSYRLNFETSLFSFRLRDALVQQRDDTGADFFINAGGANQKGIEVFANYKYLNYGNDFFEDGNFRISYTFNHFIYTDYIKEGSDYSGKKLPGIPSNTISVVGNTYLKNGLYGIFSYYYASNILLNDANSDIVKPYQILTAKVGYIFKLRKNKLHFYGGADNLFNQTYSLGNDINAAGGRYYNAAPKRNYYLGLSFEFK